MAEDKDSNSKTGITEEGAEAKGGTEVKGSNQQSQEKKGSASKEPDKSTAQQPPLLKDPAVTASSTKPEKTGKQKSGRGIAWVAILFAVIGLGAAGYTYWQFERYKNSDLASAKDTEQRTYERLQRETGPLEQELAATDTEMQNQQRAISELRDRVAAARRQIGEITHVSRKSWMLAEAEYLLRLANQRLVMEQETSSALALLKAADQILLETDDINLHQVRAAIADEMAALRATGSLDVEGAFLSLAALAGQLKELPLISPRAEQAESAEGGVEGNSFSNALARLEKLVTVRNRENPVAPLLPPTQHYYVQQNLRLMLEQAQLALLQRQPLLYSQSLGKAEQWIKDYFELNTSSNALLESIAELKQIQIAPELPDISGSLALLKSYLTNPELALGASAGAQQ